MQPRSVAYPAVGALLCLICSLPATLFLLEGCHESTNRNPLEPGPSCLERAIFEDPSSSDCVLPYPVGAAHPVFQSYCGRYSHGRNLQLAYDFSMPIGSEIVAARGGVVVNLVDEHDDFGPPRNLNMIDIRHDDGTAAFYAHLEKDSTLVREGDTVLIGQMIAASGSSGTSVPHLHFGVYGTWPWRTGDDLPVSFQNASGPLDARGGLIEGEVYEALTY